MRDTERIRQLIQYHDQIFADPPKTGFQCDLHDAALHRYADLSTWEKNARSYAYAIEHQEIDIQPFDRIFGRFILVAQKPAPEVDKDLALWPYYFEQVQDFARAHFPEFDELQEYEIVGTTGLGHIAWDWNLLLEIGTTGLKYRCIRNMEKNPEFYQCVIILLEAMERRSDQLAEVLAQAGRPEDAALCRRVPRYPSRTFREAVQAFHTQYITVISENPYGGNSPGRLDYYLWPFLKADLEAGRCTLEEAQDLIEELMLKIDEKVTVLDGYVEAVVIGGTAPDGTSAVNPLTEIMIRSVEELNITHPSVYVRMPENPPEGFVEMCAEYLKNGTNRAQILNDKCIMEALIRDGVPAEDAAMYYCGGCMEVGVQGKTGDFLFNSYQNIPKILELTVTGGYSLTDGKQLKHHTTRSLRDYGSFEEFYQAFLAEYRKVMNMFFRMQDFAGELSDRQRPAFLASSMIHNCVEQGTTMHGGGTVYYDYGSTPLGLPNTADGLFAIKKAIFDDRICTADELLEALKCDYAGMEELRQKLVRIPKYGQENAEADAMMARLVADVSKIYKADTNRFGGHGKMVIMTFAWAEHVGSFQGASPDGSHAHKNIAHGVTPQSSSMTEGITAAIHSCTSIPFEEINGGASTMWDMDSSWATEPVIGAVLTAFFRGNGMIFQGNVTSVEELIQAQKHPEDYPNLIVRVGGFSARFVSLDRGVQDDIIRRVRHAG